MAVSSSINVGKRNGYLYQLFSEKVKMQRIAITGFTTYATNGVEYDICGNHGFAEGTTAVILEPDATYFYTYDKANNKILFYTAGAGTEVSNSTNISSVTIYGYLIGK